MSDLTYLMNAAMCQSANKFTYDLFWKKYEIRQAKLTYRDMIDTFNDHIILRKWEVPLNLKFNYANKALCFLSFFHKSIQDMVGYYVNNKFYYVFENIQVWQSFINFAKNFYIVRKFYKKDMRFFVYGKIREILFDIINIKKQCKKTKTIKEDDSCVEMIDRITVGGTRIQTETTIKRTTIREISEVIKIVDKSFNIT